MDRRVGAHGLDRIFLVAPSSTDARLAMTAEASSGFVYATAVMGVTGAREQTSSLAPTLVARLRKVTDKPVGVGLGVSNGAQAREVAAFADAVIVGSALVRCLLDASRTVQPGSTPVPGPARLRRGDSRDVLRHHPEPVARRLAHRPGPAAGLRAGHHHRRRVALLIGERRFAARGGRRA